VCGLRMKALQAKSFLRYLEHPVLLKSDWPIRNVRAIGRDATVTSVDFSIGPIKPSRGSSSTRGRNGGVRKELAARVMLRPGEQPPI
jgi:hypothetical protein